MKRKSREKCQSKPKRCRAVDGKRESKEEPYFGELAGRVLTMEDMSGIVGEFLDGTDLYSMMLVSKRVKYCVCDPFADRKMFPQQVTTGAQLRWCIKYMDQWVRPEKSRLFFKGAVYRICMASNFLQFNRMGFGGNYIPRRCLSQKQWLLWQHRFYAKHASEAEFYAVAYVSDDTFIEFKHTVEIDL